MPAKDHTEILLTAYADLADAFTAQVRPFVEDADLPAAWEALTELRLITASVLRELETAHHKRFGATPLPLIAEIRAEYRKGVTVAQVAKTYGISPGTARKWRL